ncbi:hypothetical protein VTL71DRAFT_9096 [Oculimacula yallundae]|uniref:Uncharacterized protein n=1 Tax=Oculimacula yallundae TaxID=86028 RepID=A0ABR4BTT9_9HELO
MSNYYDAPPSYTEKATSTKLQEVSFAPVHSATSKSTTTYSSRPRSRSTSYIPKFVATAIRPTTSKSTSVCRSRSRASSTSTSYISRVTSTTSHLSTNTNLTLFPREFAFYTTSMSDLVIKRSSLDPSPLYYISQSTSLSPSRPEIRLFPGPSKSPSSYTVLASASLSASSSSQTKALITLGPSSFGSAPTEPLRLDGFWLNIYQFSLYLPQLQRREAFEWKNSTGQEVQALGHSSGMKLVRVRRSTVVAAYAHINCAVRKKGKMMFMKGEREILGTEFEKAAVVSLLAVLGSRKKEYGSKR